MIGKVTALLFSVQVLSSIGSPVSLGGHGTNCRPGRSPLGAANSCKQIFRCYPEFLTAFYWIKVKRALGFGYNVQKIYCVKATHQGTTGGFTSVARLNMANSEGPLKCPQPLHYVKTGENAGMCFPKSATGGCSTMKYTTFGVPYSMVCGKIKGYAFGSPRAFDVSSNTSKSGFYVDGVTITHGPYKRHIWTYAAGTMTNGTTTAGSCPCSGMHMDSRLPPPHIGESYYCESSEGHMTEPKWHLDNPLWDGEGCSEGDYCCSRSGLPWFCNRLPVETSDDIEVHVCLDEPSERKNIGIEQLELRVF
jgi:hypothetical protein